MDNKRIYIKKNILKIILVFILIIFIISIIHKYGKYFYIIKFNTIINFIKSYGKFSAVVFIIIYTLKPILFIVPSSVLSIIAGYVYGPYIAIILNMIGCIGAGTIAFFIARLFGRSVVDKIIKGKVLKLDNNIEKNGFKIILFMRLSFIFPYDTLSYTAGLTKMKYSDFIFGTTFGIIPEMISYSFMGHSMIKPFSIKFFIPVIFLTLVVIITVILKKRTKNIQ
jgi:uncharacterized membrane protein YdjX (TVP38/TMEM64 family)